MNFLKFPLLLALGFLCLVLPIAIMLGLIAWAWCYA